jgi:hypothetical protein
MFSDEVNGIGDYFQVERKVGVDKNPAISGSRKHPFFYRGPFPAIVLAMQQNDRNGQFLEDAQSAINAPVVDNDDFERIETRFKKAV